MGTPVPPRHPLRQLFGALTEKSFTEHLGWPDAKVASYVSNLLVEFTHTDQLYKIRSQQNHQLIRSWICDERMRAVVEQALAGNRDLRLATLNVRQVSALYRIQRADLSPASACRRAGRAPGYGR
ncbi:MAG: hypothetical protein IPM58_09595 [Nitrospira sp.]|nr:hypothetical protein [Nitrospira sp.]